MAKQSVQNTTWDELEVGASASLERICTPQDLILFAHVSGNRNPLMLPADSPAVTADPIAPSLWVGSLVSAVMGNVLPGPGTLYRGQSFRFHRRVRPGDRLTIAVRCIEKREKPIALFETRITKSDGTLVVDGVAELEVPTERIVVEPHELPGLIIDLQDHFARLIAAAKTLPPLPTAVVCPDDRHSLGGALLSAAEGLITPILIGGADRIRALAAELQADITGFEIIDCADATDAAAKAVALVLAGRAAAVMKGNLHSDTLLAEVVKKDGGLRCHRRISHTFAIDAPTIDHLLFISDAAINIAPDLVTKVDIVQNAIDLARACGVTEPRVGLLSAVETVTPHIPSTLDAAAIAKMAERGQIKGGIVDGPLAMDNAVDITAAKTKGIVSLVAGRADVLIVPNLEAGNMLAKEFTFVAKAEAAGLVLGARAPVMLTSRADNDRARLGSCALAQLYDYWRRTGELVVSASTASAMSEAAE